MQSERNTLLAALRSARYQNSVRIKTLHWWARSERDRLTGYNVALTATIKALELTEGEIS